LRALRQVSAAFLAYYHLRTPHRALRAATEGTRYPGVWLQQHQAALRPLLAGFSLTHYQDRQGRLVLPLAHGRVSFIRRLDADGQIDLNGWAYFVGKRLTGCYVTAAIFPQRQALVVKQARSVRKRFPFSISEPVVARSCSSRGGGSEWERYTM